MNQSARAFLPFVPQNWSFNRIPQIYDEYTPRSPICHHFPRVFCIFSQFYRRNTLFFHSLRLHLSKPLPRVLCLFLNNLKTKHLFASSRAQPVHRRLQSMVYYACRHARYGVFTETIPRLKRRTPTVSPFAGVFPSGRRRLQSSLSSGFAFLLNIGISHAARSQYGVGLHSR